MAKTKRTLIWEIDCERSVSCFHFMSNLRSATKTNKTEAAGITDRSSFIHSHRWLLVWAIAPLEIVNRAAIGKCLCRVTTSVAHAVKRSMRFVAQICWTICFCVNDRQARRWRHAGWNIELTNIDKYLAHWDSGIHVVAVQQCVLDDWILFSTIPRYLGTPGLGPYFISMLPNSGHPELTSHDHSDNSEASNICLFGSVNIQFTFIYQDTAIQMCVSGYWTWIYRNLWAWHAISITIIRKHTYWISPFSMKIVRSL